MVIFLFKLVFLKGMPDLIGGKMNKEIFSHFTGGIFCVCVGATDSSVAPPCVEYLKVPF